MCVSSLSVCALTHCLEDHHYHLSFNGYGCVSVCRASGPVHAFVFVSHRLVLLPRPLEVHAAVLSALDHRPSAAGCFHVAIHLHS